jgi:hypothetical protein
VVVLFGLGPAFGGFRIAGRPGFIFGLNHPVAFNALEQALDAAQGILRSLAPKDWAALTEAELERVLPWCDGRKGEIELGGQSFEDRSGEVVARTFLPFRYWPFGGWAVYEGWRRSADGTWAQFSDEESMQLW